MLTIFSAVAEMERNIIVERTLAGQESARRRGAMIGRRKGLSKKAETKSILAENYYRDPYNWLKDVLEKIQEYKVNRLDELLPNKWEAP